MRTFLFAAACAGTALAWLLTGASAVQAAPPTAAPQPVLLRVWVPPNAEVWFNGARTSQRGPYREFVSPPIAAGRDYVYNMRVRWMNGSTPREETRTITVRAGQQVNLVYARPAGLEPYTVVSEPGSTTRFSFYPGEPATETSFYPSYESFYPSGAYGGDGTYVPATPFYLDYEYRGDEGTIQETPSRFYNENNYAPPGGPPGGWGGGVGEG